MSSKENQLPYPHFNNLIAIDQISSLTHHTKVVCPISQITTPQLICYLQVLRARRRSCLTEVVKLLSMERQTEWQYRGIQAKTTSALSTFIAWTITRTKERVRRLRADSIWIIRCFHHTESKAQSALMKSRDVSEASMQFSCQKFSQVNMVASLMTTVRIMVVVEFTTTSPPLISKIVQWSQNLCHVRRVTNVWW